MNLVLIGYRGSGKSCVGRALAGRLGWSFVDTDALIEEQAGMTIREIFAERTESGFRDLESRVVADVAAGDKHIISTGGGVVLRPENVQALQQTGRLIYLTAPADVLWQRIWGDAHRHATRLKMDPRTGPQQVSQAVTERHPIYARVCNLMVDTTALSVDEVAEQIITRFSSFLS